MKLKIMFVIVLLLLILPYVLALSQSENEIEIPYGQNTTASLPLFSKTYLRLHEGTKLDFNVVDPDTNIKLIRNSMIIQEIGRNSTKVLLSIDGSDYNETLIPAGKEVRLNYPYKFNPFLVMQQIITRYDINPEEREVVFYFNLPFPKNSKDFGGEPSNGSTNNLITPDSVTPKSNTSENKSYGTIILVSIIILLIILIVYFKFRKKN